MLDIILNIVNDPYDELCAKLCIFSIIFHKSKVRVKDVTGCTRLGLPPHLLAGLVPHRGDGGNPGGRSCRCLSNERATQIALVELKLQDPATYKATHPKAYR